jgi:geranylgeranyl pyrophosphate synthase
MKTPTDVRLLRGLLRKYGSIDYARSVALRYADRARRSMSAIASRLPDSPHRQFLTDLTEFTLARNH